MDERPPSSVLRSYVSICVDEAVLLEESAHSYEAQQPLPPAYEPRNPTHPNQKYDANNRDGSDNSSGIQQPLPPAYELHNRILPPRNYYNSQRGSDNAAFFPGEPSTPNVTEQAPPPAYHPQDPVPSSQCAQMTVPPPYVQPCVVVRPAFRTEQPNVVYVAGDRSLQLSSPSQPRNERNPFAGIFILACVAVWLCGVIFGVIAFGFAGL